VQEKGYLVGVDDDVDDLQAAVTTWPRTGGDVDGEDTGKQGRPGPRLHAVGSGRRSVPSVGQQPAGEVEQRQLHGVNAAGGRVGTMKGLR
jgi:hypothetical protein